METGGDTVDHLGEAATNLTPSNQSREGSAAYYVGKGTSLLHKMAKKEGASADAVEPAIV